MSLFRKLERNLESVAVPHLTRWIVLFNVLGYIAIQMNPSAASLLTLNADAVLRGEVWRLITYLFIPPTTDFIWIIFALAMTYFVGEGLEQEWGAFRLNLFYFLGMLGTTAAAFLAPGSHFDNTYLNISLFLAFATIYPDFVIQVMLIIPVKAKWLGYFSAALLAFTFVVGNVGTRLAIAVSVLNYFLFFGKSILTKARMRRQSQVARERFEPEVKASFHECITCKRTEGTDPHLVFRVANDGEEYCADHLPKRS